MREEVAHWIQRSLRRFSFDVSKFDPWVHPLARRARLLEVYGVDLILDIGANIGQWALEMRGLGYRGAIVSYEPLSQAYAALRERSAGDRRWRVVHCGLGSYDGTATIHVAGNSLSSSLLPMLDEHLKYAPESAYIGREEIAIRTLASALDEHRHLGKIPFVKIDAQGYERTIIDSAGPTLDRVAGMQLEMSIVPLYEGEELLPKMIEHMAELGFTLESIEPGYADRNTGRLLQADGLFFRHAPSTRRMAAASTT